MSGCQLRVGKSAGKILDSRKFKAYRSLILERMTRWAAETAHPLDNPSHRMKRMPADLKDVRKIRVGRHRCFFTGHSSGCCYTLIYVKTFKRSGVQDEDSGRFQQKLISMLVEASSMPPPDDSSVE